MNGDIELTRELNEVVVIDAVRTAFGRAGEKGLFWNTRAEDLLGGPSAFNMGMTAENIHDRYPQ